MNVTINEAKAAFEEAIKNSLEANTYTLSLHKYSPSYTTYHYPRVQHTFEGFCISKYGKIITNNY